MFRGFSGRISVVLVGLGHLGSQVVVRGGTSGTSWGTHLAGSNNKRHRFTFLPTLAHYQLSASYSPFPNGGDHGHLKTGLLRSSRSPTLGTHPRLYPHALLGDVRGCFGGPGMFRGVLMVFPPQAQNHKRALNRPNSSRVLRGILQGIRGSSFKIL